MSKRVLLLSPYPHGSAPSQRFRFEQYLEQLRADGFEIDQRSFWDEEAWRVLYKDGHRLQKVTSLVSGFVRRFAAIAAARNYDYVFIHLEAAPLGPPIIEAALIVFGNKVIYDIDDAIYISPPQEVNKPIRRLLKWRSKVAWTAKNAHKVTTANSYLAEWAHRLNPNVEWVPTTVDPNYHRPPLDKPSNERPIIGWTGTFSTAPYLEIIREALVLLDKTHDFTFRVICNKDPDFSELKSYEYLSWKEKTEIEDLWPMDIGLMPLPDMHWIRGKLGFKAIQYSAIGIPSVVSDVGTSRDVVEDGKTGLLVPNTTEAWREALAKLLDDREMRARMGQAARGFVMDNYAIPAQQDKYRNLFA